MLLTILIKKRFIFEKTPVFNIKAETLKKIIPNFIYAVIFTLVFALILGYKPLIVTSGSMRPSIEPGAVVLIHSIKKQDLKIGDVVTFSRAGNVNTTHQIVAIKENGTFVEGEIVECDLNGVKFNYEVKASGGNILTHGTGNELGTVDSPITYENIKGKVYYCVWYVGLILITLKNQFIWLIVMLVAVYFAHRNYLYIPQYEI